MNIRWINKQLRLTLYPRVRLIFEKLTLFQFKLNRPSKPGFFTLVGFLKVILKTLEGCEISGG